MITTVARVYRFRGTHRLPSLGTPWDEWHDHDYTVEVVARGELPLVLDTDALDAAWAKEQPAYAAVVAFAPDQSTVEALAAMWLTNLRAALPAVCRVVVREDHDRWGAAES